MIVVERVVEMVEYRFAIIQCVIAKRATNNSQQSGQSKSKVDEGNEKRGVAPNLGISDIWRLDQ